MRAVALCLFFAMCQKPEAEPDENGDVWFDHERNLDADTL